MYRYEINHMNSENSVAFESLKEVSAYTGLNMYLVKHSISNNLCIKGWKINRKKCKRNRKERKPSSLTEMTDTLQSVIERPNILQTSSLQAYTQESLLQP